MLQADCTICLNMTVEAGGLAVVGHLKVVVLQIGYLAILSLNEGRVENSDKRYAPAGKVSGFTEEL
jgi:hypothetical protein